MVLRPRRTPKPPAWVLAAVCVLCAGVCAWIGSTYISRLSDHRGYYLVEVVDPVRAEPPRRPRTTTLVVVDGLRRDAAQSMEVVRRLGAHGQCRDAEVGSYTVSRPIYALLSTGLEVDRSGARNNDETSALHAESIWDVAVEAGLTAGVASQLPWWHQLFPRALAAAVEVDKGDNVFHAAAALRTDLTVVHPVYVDTAGHDAGGDSKQYRAAVARADAEATAWLETLDLSRDLVIFTADHGHVDAGGHGAQQPEVATVWVCFTGPGIAHRSTAPPLDSRVIAPAIAVALGLRFPKHMRAGTDGLDQLWTLFDPLPAAYEADRRRSIALFRDRNAAALSAWVGRGEAPTWEDLVDLRRRARWKPVAWLLAALAAALGFALHARALTRRQVATSLLWIAGTFAATCATWVLLRGSFDYTSINERNPFIINSLSICGVAAIAATWLHRRLFADPLRRAADHATLALVVLGLCLAHTAAFGWPLGFPVPHRIVLFFPFFGAVFGCVHAGVGATTAIVAARASASRLR